MSSPWIVQGDKTSHGGTVIEGDPTFTTHGKPVAHVGHMVTCPKCKGGPFPIVTGAPDFINNGKPVARHGDKVACGATLISSQSVSTWGPERSTNDSNRISQVHPIMHFDQHFQLHDEHTGDILSNRRYRMHYSSGVVEGYTNSDGFTQKIAGSSAEEVRIGIFAEGV